MKILLFGRTGQVGTALGPRLRSIGELIALDRKNADLTKPDEIRGALAKYAPDLIVNAAAYTNVDEAERKRDLAFAVNAQAPLIMAVWAKKNRAALVHYSTDYIFSGSGDLPRKEEDPAKPINVYGESKLAGEKGIIESGCPHLILRTSWIYSGTGKNFLLTMLRMGKEKEELKVVSDQIGAPTPAYVVAQSTASILAQSACNVAEWIAQRGGIFHLTCSGETSWHGFAESIFNQAAQLGMSLSIKRVVPIRTEEFRTAANRPRSSRLSTEKLTETFQIRPPHWNQALASVFLDFRPSLPHD